ncbi:HCL071Wp [Eremothecium sinecaudum]|uniref:ditrans,polycis-polyprenyl diphosphate synthase [(2E,6E)-farnesyldiphosphate specific] n=1 Tax=Eremothecium sinecaudum TaxID=45286 RepID=A0A0X8HRG5_9SACH|nr:HCL071Wp [Eremothecium sinecaudum]AMD20080.1 HCL071Wp [Eremothecium sinecaudum]
MSKLTRRVIESHSSRETQDTSHSRVPPPDCISPNPSNSTFSDFKKMAEYTLTSPTANEEINKRLRSQNMRDVKLGSIQFIFYKTLLIILYGMYACYRYFQYQYNRIRIKLLNLAYSPSNTPQLIRQDVMKLKKIPKRLATILEYKSEGEVGGGVNGLINDGSNVVCWSVSAGIKHVTLYDYDGVLKRNVHKFRQGIHDNLARYYSPTNVPKFSVKIPHFDTVYYGYPEDNGEPETGEKTKQKVDIEVSLLSVRDGRETIVELTRAMADLCRSGGIKLTDITMKLVDKELNELVGREPDLLVYFGPHLDLQGFPPWHIRLTEFYWEEDNDEVMYSVFIRGLIHYSTCKVNVGK